MLYFHANAEDLGMCYYMLDCLKERLGVRVLAMEYPGYGLHGYKGKDTKQLQRDALTVYDFVNQVMKVNEKDIFLYGRSVGCSVATYIAKHRQPGFTILMSPFKSLKQAAVAVVGNFLSNFIAERMDNAEMLQEVESPVMIVHGQKDELIPFSQSQELLDHCYKSRHTHLVLPPNMTHNKFNIETDLVMPLTKFLQ